MKKADDIVVTITNALGNCVYTNSYSNITDLDINVGNLSNGLYFISVAGKKVGYKTKFIKN